MTDYRNTFVDEKTMWLVTLPAKTDDGESLPEENFVAILVRQESWEPPSEGKPGELLWSTCKLTLYLGEIKEGKTETFEACYRPQLCSLQLFTEEFMVEPARLRGRGLGTWITQQFVLWARGLPPETRIVPIVVSPVDEKEEDNKVRRDSLWHAIGFSFSEGKRKSQPLRIEELQWPEGRHSTLITDSLPHGVSLLTGTLEKQKNLITELDRSRETLKASIKYLEDRQCHIQLREGVKGIIFAPILWTAIIVSSFWLYFCR